MNIGSELMLFPDAWAFGDDGWDDRGEVPGVADLGPDGATRWAREDHAAAASDTEVAIAARLADAVATAKARLASPQAE